MSEFSAASMLVVDILEPNTPFAQAIVRRQAERAGLAASTLAHADLPTIIPLVVAASQAFVDPDIIARLRALARAGC